MKKLLSLSLMLGAMAFAMPSPTEAKTVNAAVSAPQIHVQIGRNNRNRRWNKRGNRVVTTTRVRRTGFRTYRETIRTTYLPNGGTRTVVVDRVRVR